MLHELFITRVQNITVRLILTKKLISMKKIYIKKKQVSISLLRVSGQDL